jgi:hypothetical protein
MALYMSGMASTSCSTSDWERNRGGLSGSEGSGTLIASVVSNRRIETLAKREDSFAHGGGGEAGGSHFRHPASNRRVGDPDQRGSAEPGQHLHLQRDLESCAGGQPEVVPGLDPLGGPLLEPYLTTTGIAPQSAADVELDLSFLSSASTRRRLVSLCGLPAASR